MDYHFEIEKHPTYLHAKASGTHSAANVERFLRDAYEACVANGYLSLLVEVSFDGASLDFASIYEVISKRSATGMTLKKVGYVDASSTRSPDRMRFAETVALNRGVNVRLFRNLAEAKAWMESTK